jgi:uncharacterized protein (TIGR03437 family)
VFAAPSIDHVIDGASYANAATVKIAPGSYIAVKGTGLSPSTRMFATPYLPLSLSDVSVSFDSADSKVSVPGRVYYTSPGQLNVLVPWEVQGLGSVLMKVSIGAAQSAYDVPSMYTLPLTTYAPNFFEYPEASSGSTLVAARDTAGQLIGSGNPAKRGQVVVLYANGLGPVDTPLASGDAAPIDRLIRTTSQPTVSIGGTAVPAANIQFSGLTPSVVSLYQINVLVPDNAPTGPQSLTVSIGGATSKQSILVIQ